MSTTKNRIRRSVGSGKTRGAVSLAEVSLSTLLKALGNPSDRSTIKVQVGRVYAEGHGLKLKKVREGETPKMVLQ